METILTWTLNKMSDILLHIKEWLGMNTVTTPEKLPSYIVQVIENMELTKVLGVLKKRKGYANIVTSGLTSLKSMIEFKDSNGNRQILIQDGTDIKEIEYSGGSYQAPSAISNDKRSSGATVGQIYPVSYNGVVRSGAGIGANQFPILYKYMDAITYFPGIVSEETNSAGKYLFNQFLNDFISDNMEFDLFYEDLLLYHASATSRVGMGLCPFADDGETALPNNSPAIIVYASIYLRDGQRLPPYKVGIIRPENLEYPPTSIRINIGFSAVSSPIDNRIKGIILFAGEINESEDIDENVEYPAYYWQTIDFDKDGSDTIIEKTATFENANPPTSITFDEPAQDWETFDAEGYYIDFTYGGNDYSYKLGARSYSAADGNLVTYAIDGTVASVLQNANVTVKIRAKWENDPADINFVYEKTHVVLGAEMYTYLNIPKGDKGLDDYKYKFYVQAGKRGVIVRANNGLYAYYSPPFAYDTYPAQNEIVLLKEPTGAIDIGDDVLIFYKDQTERIAIYDNANIQRVEDYKLFGLTNQKALIKISDYEIFGMDYRGPWFLTERESHFIGEPLEDWWLDKLSDEEKENCVVGYNRLKGWIIYSFPTYSSADYPNGIVFVFDLKAFKQDQRMIPWWILKTDVPIYNLTLAEDLHLLTGSLTKIVDWNNDSEDEVVNGKIKVKLLRHPLPGSKRVWFDRIFLSINLDGSDTATINMYYNESTTAQTVTLNSDGNAILRYIAETLEAEVVITGSVAGDKSEVSELLITGTPRSI